MIFTPFLISHRRPDASGIIIDDLNLFVVYEDDDTQWTITPTSGPAETLVAYPGSALIGDQYFQFGGQTATSTSAQFLAVHTRSGLREILSALGPSARTKPAMAAVGTVIYLYGGSSNVTGTGYLGDFWKYENGSWTQLDSETVPALYGAKMVSVGSELFLVGGVSASGPNTSIWRYNGVHWLQLPVSTAELGASVSACQFVDSLICVSPVGTFVLDTLTIEWTELPWVELSFPQDGHLWALDEYRVAYLGGGSGSSIEKLPAHVLDFSAEEVYDLTGSNPSSLGYVGSGSCSNQGTLYINSYMYNTVSWAGATTYSHIVSGRAPGLSIAYVQ